MKNPWIVVLVVAAVLIGGSVWYAGNAAEKSNEGIVFTPNVKGNLDASVTLTEYSDFQCPACAAFHPRVAEILEDFPDDVKLEYKHFPLVQIHPYAEPAARAAEAAGQQDKFFEFHDLLFNNQTTWSTNPNPSAFFFQYAGELGLDVPLFKRHYNASLIRDRVQDDFAEARELGLSGTPSFFLNGERMVFETYEEFYQQVSDAVNPTVEFGITQ